MLLGVRCRVTDVTQYPIPEILLYRRSLTLLTVRSAVRLSRYGPVIDRDASSAIKMQETTMVDETKLNQFIGKILRDLGGVFSAPLVAADCRATCGL